MTPIERLQSVAPLLVAALLGLGVVLFALSVLMFRRSRRSPYWRQRRAAGQAGFRLFVWSVIMSVAGIMLGATTALATWMAFPNGIPTPAALLPSATPSPEPSATSTEAPTLSPTPDATLPIPTLGSAPFASLTETPAPIFTPPALPATPTPSPSPTPSSTPSATATLTLTFTPSATPSPTPSATPTLTFTPSATPTDTATFTPTATPTPSATPSPTLIPLSLLSAPTLHSSVTPSAQARLSILAIGTRLNASGQIVNARPPLRTPAARLYFAVRAENLQSGVLWRRELWHNGALMQAATYLWGARGDGQAVFFFGQAEGFPTGDYEIRLYLGASEVPAARAAFRLE